MTLSESMQSILDSATASSETGIPGLAFIAVDKSGSVLTANASGVRSIEKKVEMTTDTVFFFASCTKLITCIAAMQLVEQGKLHLDDGEEVCSINASQDGRC
jgi:CubicO group peptidase (beta-lactamase class C family)